MKRAFRILAVIAVAGLVPACSSEDMDYFLNSGTSNYTPGWGDYSPQGQTAGVARCYQTSRERQTCFR